MASMYFKKILQAPCSLITPLEDALISNVDYPLLRRDMLCRGVNVWKKKTMTYGYFAYWTHMSFLLGDIDFPWTGKLLK
jgi:hypothetical protein